MVPSSAGAVTPTLLTGIVARNGTPVSGASVSVAMWPNNKILAELPTGAKVPKRQMGTYKSNASGLFAIPTPASIPASYLGPNGVDVELTASDGTWQVGYNTTVARAASGRWASTQAVQQGRSEPTVVHFDLGSAPKAAESQALASSEAVPRVRGGANIPIGCGTSAGDWHRALNEVWASVYAWGGAYATVHQEVGNTHTLGIGIQYSGQGWGVNGHESISASQVGSAQRGGVADAYVHNLMDYRDFWTTSPCSYLERRPMGVYAFLSSYTWAGHPLYGHCVGPYTGGEYGRSSGANRTFSQGMDIGPISVDSESGYSATSAVNWYVTKPTWLCGDDNSFTQAHVPQARSYP